MKAMESRRGCGYRQVGKLYLIGEGITYVCPSLPLDLGPCSCCGYEVPFYRDFQWIAKAYFKHIREPTGQPCHPSCPICYPSQNAQDRYGLMWVGKKFYTPREFIDEADAVDVCKAIKQIPTGLVLGETWVMLVHSEARVNHEAPEFQEAYSQWLTRGVDKEPPDPEPKPPAYPGVFFAFRPTRVELLVYQSEATPQMIEGAEKKGITIIVVPDEYDAHARKSRKSRGRRNR